MLRAVDENTRELDARFVCVLKLMPEFGINR